MYLHCNFFYRMSQRGALMTEDHKDHEEDEKEPIHKFFEYLPLQFWEEFAEQTNLYSTQQRDLRSVKTTANELLKFVGLSVAMGTLKYPQTRMYWSRNFGQPLFTDTMNRDRFFELRNYLHFADNNTKRDGNDKLFKVSPFLDFIRKKCITLPRSKHLSIDEQMIPFSGRCLFRQYVPSKPNPLGLKVFVLASNDGLVLDFKIYQGKGTIPEEIMKEFGLGAGIVKILTENLEAESVIYTDRFFTSVKCADYLLEKGLYSIGTVMSNRIGPISKKLKSDKEMKRGQWDERVREDNEMCILKWKDNKSVLLLSTCMGSEPVGTCKRWSKEKKEKIDVPQPAVVKAYNMHMGGIDLCDRFMAYYRCTLRTKKWPLRVFSHFIDLIIVNCWVMHRRLQTAVGTPKRKLMSLMEYKMHISQALIKFEGILSPIIRRGRPKKDENTPVNETSKRACNADDVENTPKRQRKVTPQPLKEVRLDNVHHLPKFMDDKFASKCRYPGCKSRSRIKCSKCDIYLCVLKNNCFFNYHTE